MEDGSHLVPEQECWHLNKPDMRVDTQVSAFRLQGSAILILWADSDFLSPQEPQKRRWYNALFGRKPASSQVQIGRSEKSGEFRNLLPEFLAS